MKDCKPEPEGTNYRRYFTSSRGKVFDAWDYGHKAWPIGRRGKGK